MEVERVVDVRRVIVEWGSRWPWGGKDEVSSLVLHCPPAYRRRQLWATRRDVEVERYLAILIGVEMLLGQVDENLAPHAGDAVIDQRDLRTLAVARGLLRRYGAGAGAQGASVADVLLGAR